MTITERLSSFGLNHSEVTVYLFLLENGLSSPPQIATGTRIARTHCYTILQNLKNQYLVSEHRIGKRKAYVGSDPEALFRSLEEKRELVEKMLPDLRALYKTQRNKPTIYFYDGFAQVKEIYYQALTAEKIYGIGSTKQLSSIDSDFYTRWLEAVKKSNVVFYDILSHASGEQGAPEMKSVLRGLYDAKLLPKEYSDTPTDILVWNHSVALITLEEPIFGTVLTNPLLAKTLTTIFHVLWGKLSSYQDTSRATLL